MPENLNTLFISLVSEGATESVTSANGLEAKVISSVSVVDSTGVVLPLVYVIVTPSVSSSVVVTEIVLSASAA